MTEPIELTVENPLPPRADDHRVLGVAVRAASLETGRIPPLIEILLALVFGIGLAELARWAGLSRLAATGLAVLPWLGLNLYWWLNPFRADFAWGWVVAAVCAIPLLALIKTAGRWVGWLTVGLIVVIVGTTYAATLSYGFFWDDYHIARPWRTSEVLQTFVGSWDTLKLEVPYYRPLTVLSFALDWRVWQYTLGGYHLTNLLLYGASTLLFYAWLRRLGLSYLLAGVGAVLWALLPPDAATVSWLSERSDTLALIGCLAGLLAFATFLSGGQGRWLALANLALIAALLSKELGLVLPLFFLLYAWLFAEPDQPGWPWGKWWANRLLSLGLPFVIVGLYLLLRRSVLPSDDSTGLAALFNPERFVSIVYHACFGLDRLVGDWIAPWLTLWLVGWLGVGLVFKKRLNRMGRLLCFGLGWYLISCLPLVTIKYRITPRLFYLPEAGYVIVLMVGLYYGLEWLKRGRQRWYFGPALALSSVLILAPSLPSREYNECAQAFYAPDAASTLHWDEWIYNQAAWQEKLPSGHLQLIAQKLRANGLLQNYKYRPYYPPPSYQCDYVVDSP